MTTVMAALQQNQEMLAAKSMWLPLGLGPSSSWTVYLLAFVWCSHTEVNGEAGGWEKVHSLVMLLPLFLTKQEKPQTTPMAYCSFFQSSHALGR